MQSSSWSGRVPGLLPHGMGRSRAWVAVEPGAVQPLCTEPASVGAVVAVALEPDVIDGDGLLAQAVVQPRCVARRGVAECLRPNGQPPGRLGSLHSDALGPQLDRATGAADRGLPHGRAIAAAD